MTQASFVENSHGRHSDDFYRTPPEVTRALCDEFRVRGIEPKTILDVGCGDGAIGMVCRQAWRSSRIVGVEIDRGRWQKAAQTGAYNCVDRMDWISETPDNVRDWTIPGVTQADLIVSNPAFKIALPSLRFALQRVRSGGHVAFLLISQWDQETVHGDERGRFLDSLRKPNGSEGYGKLRWKGRIDFRGDGRTDRVSHEWLIIGPGFEGSFVRVPRSPMGGSGQLTMGVV
jgi:hypothetical protein